MISSILPTPAWHRPIILPKSNCWAARIQTLYTAGFSRRSAINLPDDPENIGKKYMEALYLEIKKWLKYRAKTGPVGVTFSAGIDSGSVFLLTYQALKNWAKALPG